MTQKANPSFYAVIPATVRYSDISANAKLLYGEITALCSKEGYCWASNSYFASLYKVDSYTVSRWVTILLKANFIRMEVDRESGNSRKIWLTEPSHNFVDSLPQKEQKDYPQKEQHSNTRVSTTIKTTFEAFWEIYPRKVSKKKALATWIRIKPDETTLKQILAALAYQMKSDQWKKDDGRFIPHPTTWLNGERWNDESKKEEPVQIARPVARNEVPRIEKKEMTPEAREIIEKARAQIGRKL